MNFGDAYQALRFAKQPIARKGWNGKGMFVYMVEANAYPATSRIAKTHFGEDALVPYGAYAALKNADGSVYPWTPSQGDLFADDWEVIVP